MKRLTSTPLSLVITTGLLIGSLPLTLLAQTSTTPRPPTVSSSTQSQAKPAIVIAPKLQKKAKDAIDQGIRFLRQQQAEDGSYGHHVGLTAMALLAMAESPRKYTPGDGPFIRKAVDFIASQARANGSITGEETPTYNTALAIMALHTLDATKYKKEIEGGQRFLVKFQSDEGQNYTKKDKYYGGIGYGGDERPDLSNLQYALEALKKTDYDKGSDVWEKAELFVKRCQNFTEEDDKDVLERPWAGNDGGFIYEPGASRAGGTKSYGAMTFAGLKSLMFTDETNKNDPRVKAALGWIKDNYDFNTHPGMGTTAYYYYLQTAASALEAYGESFLPANTGQAHNWGADIVSKFIYLQQPDGSWVNEDRKYWEGNKILVTARAIITLNHAFRASGL